MRAWRVEQSVDTLWKTGAALLACVGPGPDAEQVVRSAARLAGQLGARWHAVYVETPPLQRLDAVRRTQILDTLRLAEKLGGASAVLRTVCSPSARGPTQASSAAPVFQMSAIDFSTR